MLVSLIITCILFDLSYIYCKGRQYNLCGFFCKSLAVLSFISIGLLAYKDNESSFCLSIIIGLILDGLGDVCLALRNFNNNKKWFVLGGVMFAYGHLVYIGALLSEGILMINLELVFTSIGIVLGIIYVKLIKDRLSLSKGYVFLGNMYCSLIFMIMSLSLCVYIITKSVSMLAFLIGSILFVSSDVILILNNFGLKKKWMHPTYSLLYFMAQILISYSLHL